jgi:hypothetical protein
LTPRIIRTHEYTARDLSPIYVGTNQNFGLTGPPPLIAAPADPPAAESAPADSTPGAAPQSLPSPVGPMLGAPGATAPPQGSVAPPGSTAAMTSMSPAQVSLTAPTAEVRVGSGPYMVPVYASSISRASTVTLTVTYNPALLRVSNVQEGSFLRQGAVNVVFTPGTDPATGRIDLAFVRTGDQMGASGSGLLAAIQFDAVAAGTAALSVSGTVTDPGGATIPVQFVPASIVVR